jgi:hypothetical protein
LRLLAPQESEPPEPSKSPPRRTRVEGHTGIYQRRDATGAVLYEIGWTEAGKQRWRTIGTDLDAAIEARRSVSAAPDDEVPDSDEAEAGEHA